MFVDIPVTHRASYSKPWHDSRGNEKSQWWQCVDDSILAWLDSNQHVDATIIEGQGGCTIRFSQISDAIMFKLSMDFSA